jgi:hypothetical protein
MATSDSNQEKMTTEVTRRGFLKVAGSAVAFTAAIPSFSRLSAHAEEKAPSPVTWNGSHARLVHDSNKPNVYLR